MGKVRSGVLGVLVALVVTAIGASAAYGAHPTILVGGAASINAEQVGKGGKSTLQTLSGKTVTCTDVSSKGKLTSETKGTITFTFDGCAAAGVKCTGLGLATVGQVVVAGNETLVYDDESPLAAAVLIEITPIVHFVCSAKLVEVGGCDLTLVTPLNTSVAAGASYTVIQKQAGGDNEDLKYTLNSGELARTCTLLSAENGGTFESSGEGVEGGSFTVSVAGVQVASELMA
jgi:hypothetical protein